MAEKYPKDRFDAIPDDLQRVGAHRAPRPRGRGWIAFGWAALATVVLVGSRHLRALARQRQHLVPRRDRLALGGAHVHTPTPTPTPTIVPTVDPSLTVNVLNGTTTEPASRRTVSDTLTAAGWKIGALANANTTDVAKTVVYYSDPKNQAAALGVAQSLPGATVQQTQDYAASGADLTVVVGSGLHRLTDRIRCSWARLSASACFRRV